MSDTSPGNGAKGFGLPEATAGKVTVLSFNIPSNVVLEKIEEFRDIDFSSFKVVNNESDDVTTELESKTLEDEEFDPKYQ